MFVVTLLRSGPEWDASRPLEEQSGWPAHAAFLDGLLEDGFVVLGGPLADEHRVVHAVEAESEEAIRETLARDPWSGSHLVVDSIEPWTLRLDRRRPWERRPVPGHVPEAEMAETEHGLAATGDGWYVVNARDARWYDADGRSTFCDLEGDQDFEQLGVNLQVLGPGEAMSMYHWEADQEDFLLVAGEALLLVEGEERPLRAWDFVHCPRGTKHTIVGAGSGPCVVVAVGARIDSVDNPAWGGYPVDETALRHRAGVERETTDPREAYSTVTRRQPTRYRDGWLPG